MIKRGVILLVFWWILIFSMEGQWYDKYYGGKNLTDLSQQELSVLFQKSKNLKNVGRALTIGGIVGVTAGSAALIVLSVTDILSSMSTGNSASQVPYDIFIGSILAGTVAMIGGIPVWIIGHVRNKEIVPLINRRFSGLIIHLNPSLAFSHAQSKYYPGISISFRF
jgi:hypothetical protein